MSFNAEKIAKERGVPMRIDLYTRRGVCETSLRLVGVAENKFNYQIKASFNYTVHSDKDYCIAVDFSEGPMVFVGDVIEGMKIVEIDTPIIVFEKC